MDDNADNLIRVLLAGLEDFADASVNSAPIEAMKALNKLLPVMDRSRVQEDLISFTVRLRPSFESESHMIRAMAFALFGQAATVAENDAVQAAFVQEIHNVLVILLLHLNDDHNDVSVVNQSFYRSFALLIDRLTDSLIHLLIDWFDCQLFLWLIDWLIDRFYTLEHGTFTEILCTHCAL